MNIFYPSRQMISHKKCNVHRKQKHPEHILSPISFALVQHLPAFFLPPLQADVTRLRKLEQNQLNQRNRKRQQRNKDTSGGGSLAPTLCPPPFQEHGASQLVSAISAPTRCVQLARGGGGGAAAITTPGTSSGNIRRTAPD